MRNSVSKTQAKTNQEKEQEIHTVNQEALKAFEKKLRLKAYSPNTIKTYTNEFSALLRVLGKHPVEKLETPKIESYFLYCVNQGLSENHLNSRINAIKFYFEQVLQKPKITFAIPRPKKPLRLPRVLNSFEISKLFAQANNLKHSLMLRLCYGMGLRVSEITNLKLHHIDKKRMQVLIAAAKGKKDRYVHLPQSVLVDLEDYLLQYKPKEFLFEGQKGDKYSSRSAQAVFKLCMKKAGISKDVGIHGLRHSYATHLLETGTDISHIQKLLGHNNIKTTLIYTQISNHTLRNIKSPLDSL